MEMDQKEISAIKTHISSERITVSALRGIFSGYQPFAELPEAVLEGFAQVMQPVFVPAGERFIEGGQMAEYAYLIESGRFRAILQIPQGDVVFELGRGEFPGLFEVLSLKPFVEGALLYALRDSRVLQVSKEDFFSLTMKHSELIVAIARTATKQFHRGLQRQTRLKVRPLNFAILPLTKNSWTRECAESLQRALTIEVGSGFLLGSDDLQGVLGLPASIQPQQKIPRQKLFNWVNEREAEGQFLLFRCDPSETAWNRWCLHQVDRILVVARVEAISEIPRLDEMFADRVFAGAPMKVDLMLVHDSNVELPVDTGPWINLRCLQRHHHVRQGHVGDFRRVARRLTERGVGVVLGGGGARGLAHIGVLQALDEAGIPIDYIGGTSMGALIAAIYARGWSPPQILDKVREVLVASRAVIDVTFPMASLLAGKKLDAVLTRLFGDIAIEDLWINFFCISSSVSHARMVVHKEGLLWQSVRASLSLPGIFPPVQTGGQVLVDGGVMNNVPMDIMRAECGEGGTVIAVDVGGSGGQDSVWGKGDRSGVSGWRLLGERLSFLSRSEATPSIFQTLAWSTTLSSDQYLKQLISQGTTNLFLTPPVQDFQLLGFEAYMELYEVGYQYTRQRLAEWEGTSQLRGRTES